MSETKILRTVGWGTAASNIGPMGNTLHIIVSDWSSMYDGPINVGVDVIESTTVSDSGQVSSDKIQTTQTIHAKWLPSGSNRATAPNIRVGERVEVLEVADNEEYYWRPAGLDEHHRTLETIVWGIAATTSGDVTDPNNRYWIEFSSHSKKVMLTTSMANSERARYCISVDGGSGIFNIMDHKGNYGTLDSNHDDWKIATNQGSYVQVIQEDIEIKAVRDMRVKIGRNFTVEVGDNWTSLVTNLFGLKSRTTDAVSSDATSIKALTSVSVESLDTSIKGAASVSVESPASVTVAGGGARMSWTGGVLSWMATFFKGN